MTIKSKFKTLYFFFAREFYKIIALPWGHFLVLLISIFLSLFVFYFLQMNWFATVDTIATLTNLLTINAVFSAILITYLFSRITWVKERKLELFNEAIALSQKFTEFRRILNKLTDLYQVWKDDKATISLLKFGKFKAIDYHDYNLYRISDYKPKNHLLIEELKNHPDFQEGQTTLYLAMESLVSNRNGEMFEYHGELYKDFELSGLYSLQVVQKWINCEIFGTIWYWVNGDYKFINYLALNRDKDYILEAAARINKKYKGHQLNDDLIKELADDFNSHYLSELFLRLKELNRGVRGLNLIIIVLITISLIFGVLAPFALLLIQNKTEWFTIAVSILASINSGLIAYFIIRFPFLINRELKWT